MIFTQKVNRLEYITRNCFDNTVEEKKELMNFFSNLERQSPLTIAAQAARIEKLEAVATNLLMVIGNYTGEEIACDTITEKEIIAKAREALKETE